jgi:hypothetical protein
MKGKARGMCFGLDLLAIAGLLIAHAGITKAQERADVVADNSRKSERHYRINMSVRREYPERGTWLEGTFVPGWTECSYQLWFAEGQLGFIGGARPEDMRTDDTKEGCYPQVTVLGWESGRIRVDLWLKVNWLEKDEEDRTVVQGSTLRVKEWILVGKKVKYILTRDSGGKPESWAEVTVY